MTTVQPVQADRDAAPAIRVACFAANFAKPDDLATRIMLGIDLMQARIARLEEALRLIGSWPDAALAHRSCAEDMRSTALAALANEETAG